MALTELARALTLCWRPYTQGERYIPAHAHVHGMGRVVRVEVPEWVSEEDVLRWVAEGLARARLRELVLEALKRPMGLEEGEALREFEETRRRVWRRLREEYRRLGLLK